MLLVLFCLFVSTIKKLIAIAFHDILQQKLCSLCSPSSHFADYCDMKNSWVSAYKKKDFCMDEICHLSGVGNILEAAHEFLHWWGWVSQLHARVCGVLQVACAVTVHRTAGEALAHQLLLPLLPVVVPQMHVFPLVPRDIKQIVLVFCSMLCWKPRKKKQDWWKNSPQCTWPRCPLRGQRAPTSWEQFSCCHTEQAVASP